MSYIITFGKHKGKTWGDLIRKGDTNYVEWALDKLDINKFTGPNEDDVLVYQDKMNFDSKSSALVEKYKSRQLESMRATETHQESHAQTITPIERDHIIKLFEDDCLESFGSFPYFYWQTAKGYSNGNTK